MSASMSDRHRGNSSGSGRTSIHFSTDWHGWHLADGQSSSSKIKLICSFGGRVLPRPGDGKLRYVGGETRILSFEKNLSFAELSQRLMEIYGALSPPLILKYQLPDEELDTLIQVSSDEDLQIMMEEYSKSDYGREGSSHLRLFLSESVDSVDSVNVACGDSEQSFIDAINGVPEQHQRIAIGDDGGATKQLRNQANTVYPSVSWQPPTESVQRPEVHNHYPVDCLPLNPNLPIESVQKPEVFTHHPVDSLPLLYPKPPIEAVHRPEVLAHYPVDPLPLNPNPPIELVLKPEVFTHCPVNSLPLNPDPPIKPMQKPEVLTQYPVDSLLLNSKPLNELVQKPEAFTHYPVDSSFPLNPNPPIKTVQKPEVFTRHPVDSLPLNPNPPIESVQKPDVFTRYPVDSLPLHPNLPIESASKPVAFTHCPVASFLPNPNPPIDLAQRPGVFTPYPVNSFPLNPNPSIELAQKPEVFDHYPVNSLPLNPKPLIQLVQRSEVLTHHPIDSLPLSPSRPQVFTQFQVDSPLQNPKRPIESLQRPEVFTEHPIGSLLLNLKPPIESVQRSEVFTQCPVDSFFLNPNPPIKSVQSPEVLTQHPPDSLPLHPKTPFESAQRPEVLTQYPVDALLLNPKTHIDSVQRAEVLTQYPVNFLPLNPTPPIESVQRPEVSTQYPVNSLPMNPIISNESVLRPGFFTKQYPVDSLHLPPYLSSSSRCTPLSLLLSYSHQTVDDYFGQSYLPDSLCPHSANQASLCLENFADNLRLCESPPPLPDTPPFEEERPISRQPKQSIMDTFGVLSERASGTKTLLSTLYHDSLKTSPEDLCLTEKTQAIYSDRDMNRFPYLNSVSTQYQDGLKVNDQDLLLTEKPHAIYSDNRDRNRFPYPNPRKDNAVTFSGKSENATAETRISTQYHDDSLKARGKTNAIYSNRDIDSEKAAGTVISALYQDSLKVSDDEDLLFTGKTPHAVYTKRDIDGFPYPSSRKDDHSKRAAETVRNTEVNLFDPRLQSSLEDSLADIWGVTKDNPDREAQSTPFDNPNMPEKKDYTCKTGISESEAFAPLSFSYTLSGDECEFAHESACPWNGLSVNTPPSVENEIYLNSAALPIYDQSPMSSVKRNNHSDSVIVSKEELQTENEMAAKGMSFKRFVEDMASSVLNSSLNESLFEKRSFYEEGEVAINYREASKENICDGKDSLSETKDDQILVNRKDSSWLGAQTPLGLIETDKENSLCQKEGSKQQSADVGNDVNGNQTSFASLEGQAEALGLQTIRNADLEEIRELGSGTYGTVYYGKWRGSDVAIKRIKASCFSGSPSEQKRLISDFWKEACMLGQLHHPNVVAFYGVVQDAPGGTLATVTEYMVNGSLKQVLQKKDRTIDRRKRLLIAMDAAFGMEYLHSKNIVHFDLKCENLLVNMRDPQRPICKVGDFGLSKMKQHTLVSGGVRGTLPWMAPELLSGKSSMVTEKIDVYSFGIVMWELLTCEEPYASMHCGAIIGGIVSNSLRPPVPSWCDPAWRSLMERCWSAAPEERPPFPEIVNNLRDMATSVNLK